MIAKTLPDSRLDVAIVGGGIGGLCLAIGLLKYPQINVQVYEGAHRFAEIGAGVTIGPNARRALKLIDSKLEQAFLKERTGNGPDFPAQKNVYCRYVRGAGPNCGEVLGETWCDDGQQSVHRANFLNELVRLVPADITHFNKRLESLKENSDDQVVLNFSDGTTAEADCVIGADGVHSVVRKHLISPEHPGYHPSFTGYAAYRGLIPMEEAQALLGKEITQITTMHGADGGLTMSYPVDHFKWFNVVAVTSDIKEWSGNSVQPADLGKMKKTWADWGPTVKKIISLLDRPETKLWSLWQQLPLPTYTKSRVLVMGDAAHSTPPFQGQGAGQAIEDALVLSSLLGNVHDSGDLLYAFSAFDRCRKPRTQKMVKTSCEAGKLFTMRAPGILDDGAKFRENIEDRYDWLFNRDMQLQVDQALLMAEEIKLANGPTNHEREHAT